MAPMENGLAKEEGFVNERITRFFEERARNEVGMIMTGSVAVSPEGRGLPTQLSIYDDQFIPGLKHLTNTVHQSGALIGAQIYHAGRQASEYITGLQPIAPSAIPCDILGNNPREMTKQEIMEMKKKFVDGARRCVETGFDMIEVHFAHGYLLHSFLSPHSNKRTDEYGGSLKNRMRFPLEVLKEIVGVCNNKVAVTIRISADEYLEDGLKFDEAITVCQEAVKAGAQAISVSAGSYDAVAYTIQPMFIKQGFLVPLSKQLKKVLDVPIIVAGRLNDAELMEEIITNEEADMLAIGRGLISDEELVVKMKERRLDDIRYCVACNQGCADNVFQGKAITCLVNARAGYETKRNIQPSTDHEHVVVIGGGPAGMEAARVARLRGHNVTIIDKEKQIGGKFNVLSTPPEKDSFLLYKNYLENQMNKLRIKIVNEVITKADDIKKYNPDHVIIATGAHQTTIPIKGINLPHVMMAEDVLHGKEVGSHIAIIGGGLVGTETAKYLSDQGKTVTIIEMTDTIGNGIGATFQGHLFEFLHERHVTLLTNANITEIQSEKVILSDQDIPVDNVIIAAGYAPNNKFVKDIKETFTSVQLVGDVNQPRRIIEATEEGYLAGASI